MKKMRKLIPAFAMLMVSAIMLSTASFAWFSTNTTAKAGGMKVQATTSGGLAIAFAVPNTSGEASAPGKDTYKSNVTLATGDWTNGGYKLNPTSAAIDGNTWFKASSAAADTSTAAAGTWGTVATSEQKDYFFKTVLYVRSLNEETTGENLFVNEINVTTADGTTGSNLEKSLRVAIRVGTKILFFAPVYADSVAATSLNYVAQLTTTGEGESAVTTGSVTAYNAQQMFVGSNLLSNAQLVTSGVGYTNPTAVEVFVYFEGEDENCTSALAYNLRDLTVEVVFSTKD